MSVKFLALPQSVRYKICRFVEEPSLLTMRELSKASKEALDLSLLKTRETTVEHFYVCFVELQKRTDWPVLGLEFQSRRDYFVWMKCCIGVIERKMKIAYEISINPKTMVLGLRMSLENMIKFLNYLKPLIGPAVFSKVRIPDFNPELFIEWGKFLEGFRIKNVKIERENFEIIKMDELLTLICELSPERVIYTLPVFSRYKIDFLKKIVAITESILLHFGDECEHFAEFIPFIQHLFDGKCTSLSLSINTPKFSLSDAEKMIRFFHNTGGKAMTLRAHTNEEMMDAHFGVYKVEVYDDVDDDRRIKISHLEREIHS